MGGLFPYILKRLVAAVPAFIAITALVMLILALGPGQPKIAGKTAAFGEATHGGAGRVVVEGVGESLEVLRQKEIYGLNDSWMVQYTHWLIGTDLLGLRSGPLVSVLPNGEKVKRYARRGVLRGDFGPSFTDLRPVPDKIWQAFRVTFLMSLMATLLTYAISLALGVYSATHRGSVFDRLQTVGVFVLYSIPSFWAGSLLLLYFTGGDWLRWFPSAGLHHQEYLALPYLPMLGDYLWHLVLPLLVLTYGGFAFLSRYSRASMLEAAGGDFVRTARAKGLPESAVVWRHIFRNALIPLLTLVADLLPALLGGSIVVEQIFSIPGLGKLTLEAVVNKDYTMIMAVTALDAVLLMLGNLMGDLLYCSADPRVSLERLKVG